MRLPDTPSNAHRQRRLSRSLWIAADVVVVGANAAGIWWHWLNAVPDVTIPPRPAAPRPNGFDVAVQAGRQLADLPMLDDDGPPDRNPSSADLMKVIADNAPALRTLRSALSMVWQNPHGSDDPIYGLVELRWDGVLLRTEADARAAAGDPGGAAQFSLDAMELGADDVPRGGAIVSYSAGVDVCEALGAQSLWRLVDRLSAADARAAALRLERIEAQRVPVADVLAEEKWSAESLLLDSFRTDSLLMWAGDVDTGDEDASGGVQSGAFDDDHRSNPLVRVRRLAAHVRLQAQLLRKSKAQALADFERYQDAVIALARQPYRAALPMPAPPTDPINQAVNDPDVTRGVMLRDAVYRTRDALLMTTLALRAYRAEHGAYPAALNAFVMDGCLTRVPSDPFDPAGGTVRYRLLPGDHYLLYRVGPDGRDDGGRPIAGALRLNTPADVVPPSGDVVAGVTVGAEHRAQENLEKSDVVSTSRR